MSKELDEAARSAAQTYAKCAENAGLVRGYYSEGFKAGAAWILLESPEVLALIVALEKIQSGTDDTMPPFRYVSDNCLRSWASEALARFKTATGENK
jgi:hypothetical protein